MKERGILFSAAMVRALLAGAKTQTRRLLKPQPRGHRPNFLGTRGAEFEFCSNEHEKALGCRADEWFTCPYGVPGDRLWVRETWRADKAWDGVAPTIIPRGSSIWFAAGGEKNVVSPADHPGKTRVSIFMPRWASRITLEVTEVRVQRLQSLSEEDAKAEGPLFAIDEEQTVLSPHLTAERNKGCVACRGDGRGISELCHASLRGKGRPFACWYATLWDSINGAGSWASNPFVWAISFRRIAQ